MIISDIAAAIALGLTGGFTPGPVILLSFAEVLRSPDKGIKKGWAYVLASGLTEFAIALFLISTASFLQVPEIFFHALAIFGIATLLYIAYHVLQIKKIEYEEGKHKVKIRHIIFLMLINGPLWLFWLSVCLPAAFTLERKLQYGSYLFAIIFEISMITALAIMVYGFHYFRKHFSKPQIIGKISLGLAILLSLIALKLSYQEIIFFSEILN